jgi:hypothetical protein
MISGRPRHGAFPVPGELQEDVSTDRAAYGTIEAADERAVAHFMDPQIEWVHPAVTHLPFDGTVRCLPSVVRAAFRKNEDGSGPQIFADTAGRFIGDHGMEDPFLHECFVRAGSGSS